MVDQAEFGGKCGLRILPGGGVRHDILVAAVAETVGAETEQDDEFIGEVDDVGSVGGVIVLPADVVGIGDACQFRVQGVVVEPGVFRVVTADTDGVESDKAIRGVGPLAGDVDASTRRWRKPPVRKSP